MLTFNQLLTKLQLGELAQTSVGDISKEANVTKLTSFTNSALIQLFTDLNIKERELVIQQYDDISFYNLDSRWAATSTEDTPDGQPKYIIDDADHPFTDDILRVEQVFNEQGCEMPLNEAGRNDGAFLAAYNVIQFPQAVSENMASVTYRAAHPPIPEGVDPATFDIQIPVYCVEPLINYICYLVYSGMSGVENTSASTGYLNKYTLGIYNIREHNLLRSTMWEPNLKNNVNGWG